MAGIHDFRHGMDARIVDVDGSLRPLRQVAQRVVAEARRALASGSRDAPLAVVDEMLLDPGEPARQRRVAHAGGMQSLLRDLADRTSDLDG